MTLRLAGALALTCAIAACAQSGAPAPAAPTEKAEQVPLPTSLRVAGDAGEGLRLLSYLSADGIPASSAFTGVESGWRIFCSGGADIVAVDRNLTDAEITACKQAGGAWSGFSGDGNDAPVIYVRSEIADAFLERSSAYN